MSEDKNTVEEMTLAEVAEWEQITGQPIDDLMGNGKPRGRALAAMAFIVMKRSNPNYTMADASKLTMTKAIEIMTGATDPKEG